MTKEYYVTWSETKNKVTTDYVRVVLGKSAKEIKDRMREEQDYRKLNRKPYMFHLAIRLTRPYDADRRHLGHFYY